jgi:SAM-dependent methyltransferase
MYESSFDSWAEHYRRGAEDGSEPLWPSECLIRLFRGPYIVGMARDFRDRQVLEVGCGNGNNLVFLGSLGMRLSGTEVEESICRRTEARMRACGYDARVLVGTNRALPFPDCTFDYLVAWNVVHYEDNEADFRAALREYCRVLRPGGRLFVSTTGPEHKILDGAEKLGPHRYRIGREDDFRRGQVFFYLETEEAARAYFSESFEQVMTGRTLGRYFTDTLDAILVTGVKGEVP